jgi:DNA-binding Xre family transcriptional regulator
MPPPASTSHHALRIYARNLEILLVKAGITHVELAKRLGLSANAMNRIRFVRNAYLDPDVLFAFTRVFDCTPNDLLLPQPGVDYDTSR